MSEPQPFVINLLQQMLAAQSETNTLLRRIVPDGAGEVAGGLYGLLQTALYYQFPEQEAGQGTVTQPLAKMFGQSLLGDVVLPALREVLGAIVTNTNNTRIAAAATSLGVQDTLNYLADQIGPGTLTLNIAEQLNAIRENTAVPPEMDGVLDALNTLALQQRTLVSTENGGLQSFTTAELLYGLALCSCAEFPPAPLDPPAPAFPTCLELTGGANQQRHRFGPAVALSNVVFQSVTYEAYVHPLQDTYVYTAQGQSFTPLAPTNGNGFIYVRDQSLTWTGAASSFGWAEPGTSSPSFFLNVRWPELTPNLTQAQVQAMVDGRIGSINLKTVGRCLAGPFVATNADFENPFNWRAVVTLWLPGQGPGSQPASQYMYARANPTPGV